MTKRDDEVQKIADSAATRIMNSAPSPETVEVVVTETPITKPVALRSRRVQSGETSYNLVEGEPVDVPEGLEESWVEYGWIHYPE